MNVCRRPLVRLAAGLVVLGVVVLLTGPGPFVDGFRALDARVLLAGLLLGIPATLACAYRWRLVAAALGAPVDAKRSVLACYAAQFLNVLLPTGVAGDLHRGLTHGPAGDRLTGLRAVGWERSLGQLVQTIAALVLVAALPSPVQPLGVAACLLVVLSVLGVVLLRHRLPMTAGFIGADLRRIREARAFPGIVLASLGAQMTYLATGLLAAHAVGVTAPLTTQVPLLLLVLVAMAVPLSVLGWGPREGVAAWAFATAGLGIHLGVSVAVAYGLVVAVAALPGAVALLALSSSASRPVAQTSTQVGHRAGVTHG